MGDTNTGGGPKSSGTRGRTDWPRWFGYAVIFIVTAFVLHGFLILVALATGIVAPDSMLTVAGPVTFVAEFVLAAVITWLIVRRRPEPPVDAEAHRRGEAFLAERRHEADMVEQEHADYERIEHLKAQLLRWRTAHDLRAEVTEALEELGDGDATTDDGGSLRAELQWALEYADRIDPLHH